MTFARFELPASLLLALVLPVFSAWLLLPPRIFGRTGRLALALPMGLGMAVLSFAASLAVLPPAAAPFAACGAMAAASAIATWSRLRRPGTPPAVSAAAGRSAPPPALRAGLAPAPLLVVLGLLLCRALLSGPSSDVETLDGPVRDARDLVAHGLGAAYFAQGAPARLYAPLLSLGEGWLHALLGDLAFRTGRALPLALLGSALLLLAADLRERGARPWQAYGLAALLGASPELVSQATELRPGAAIASLLLASAISLVAGCARLRPSSFVVAGIPLAIASMAGAPGALAVPAMALAGLVGLAGRRLGAVPAAGRMGLLLAPSAAAWTLWLAVAAASGASLVPPAAAEGGISLRHALLLCLRELLSPAPPSCAPLLMLCVLLLLASQARRAAAAGAHVHLAAAAGTILGGAASMTLAAQAPGPPSLVAGVVLPATFLAFAAVTGALVAPPASPRPSDAGAESDALSAERNGPGSTLAPAGPELD